MKKIIKRILPDKLIRSYHYIKKKLIGRFKFIPQDERVFFDSASISDGHFNVKYRGISAIRCPFDYVMYQMIISELKPDLVIEIGSSDGGGALYIADLMEILGNGVIHTIDIIDRINETTKNHPRIKHFLNGWKGYDLKEARGFSKVLIIEDGSHMYEDSLGALHKFSSLVTLGSYFIVEDGIVNELGREKGFHGGPLMAIREFLKEGENKSFEVDRKYCDMFGKNATFNVNGYLKRIR